MASKLTLQNNINTEFSLEHSDNKPAGFMSSHDISRTVDTVTDMEALIPAGATASAYDKLVCVVRDLDRGGTFVYDSTKVVDDNQGTNFKGWIRQYDGSVNVKWFIDSIDSSADIGIQKAINYLSTINYFNSSTSLFFPADVYTITNTINITLADAHITFFSDGFATLNNHCATSDWMIKVDFSTGATANFIQFNMKNIILDDFSPGATRKHLYTERVIGSTFENCFFQNADIAVDMNKDSNLNSFINCQWRANRLGFKSTDGDANNNVFTNCQWRYNTGTSVDFTGTGENRIIGGDFEPHNASPVCILSTSIVKGTRFERNIQGEVIRVLSRCTVEASVFSDGGTQSVPAVQVNGNNNNINLISWSGAEAINIATSAEYNKIRVQNPQPLGTYKIIQDFGKNTVLTSDTAIHSLSKTTEFSDNESLVPSDLTTWTASNMNVTKVGTEEYSITNSTTAAGSISYSLTGTFTDLYIKLSQVAHLVCGRAVIYVNDTSVGSLAPAMEYRFGVAVVVGTFTDPIIKLKIVTDISGCGSTIKYIRVAEGKIPS